MAINIKRQLKEKKGYMLINLIFVLAVFSILITISAPALKRYQPNLKLKAESKNLISDLRYAQEMTVTTQQVHYVEINATAGQYFIFNANDPSSPIKTVQLDGNINFQEVNGFDDNKIIFNSYGAVSQAGTIVLANTQEQTATISVKPSGYVQLQQ